MSLFLIFLFSQFNITRVEMNFSVLNLNVRIVVVSIIIVLVDNLCFSNIWNIVDPPIHVSSN